MAIALQGITPSLGGGLANWLTRLRAATHRDGHMGQPFEPAQYDEVRFHAFLALEEERTRRSRRPFLLLLVDIEDPLEHGNVAMADDLAVALFDGLKGVLRETDFVGWHEQGLVVGAVLTQLSDPKPGHAVATALRRVRETLARQVPAEAAARLRVRVLEHCHDGVHHG